MSNSDTLKGQWKQLKGRVREHWGRLTDDDVESLQGNWQNLVGKLQEKYGIARDEAEQQASKFMAKVNEKLK